MRKIMFTKYTTFTILCFITIFIVNLAVNIRAYVQQIHVSTYQVHAKNAYKSKASVHREFSVHIKNLYI